MPYANVATDKPSDSDVFPSGDDLFSSEYDEYFTGGPEDDDDDESQYYTAEEVEMPLLKVCRILSYHFDDHPL